MKHFGITILYYYVDKCVNGILKSYTLELSKSSDIDSLAREKAIKEPSNYNYLGISDIYKVSGKASELQMLGRTSYYDINTHFESKSLVRSREDYSSEESSSSGYFNSSLVYFYFDADNEDDSFAFTVLTLIKAKSLVEAISKAEAISMDDLFLKKIINASADEILPDNLEFLGFNDFCNVADDVEAEGAYQTFYSTFSSLEELKREKLSESELKELIKELDL